MRMRMMGLMVLMVSACVAGTTAADGPPLQSGLKPGEFAPPFQVDDITGPNKGQTLCYR
ncbi:MAG: hypothetical protein U0794_23450 [Isosphaeraceae bacterium]